MPEFDPLNYRLPMIFTRIPEFLYKYQIESDLRNFGFDAVRASIENNTTTSSIQAYIDAWLNGTTGETLVETYQPFSFKEESVRDIIRNTKGIWNHDIDRNVPIQLHDAGHSSGRHSKHLPHYAKGIT